MTLNNKKNYLKYFLIQLLIMKMATENLKGEQQRRLEARKNYIEQRLKPLDNFNSLSDGNKINFLQRKIKILGFFFSFVLSSTEITLSRTS